MFRRLSLACLLTLLLVGLAGHSVAHAGKIYHAVTESTCAFHAGILVPVIQQSHPVEANIPPQSDRDITSELNLGAKILHPPTI